MIMKLLCGCVLPDRTDGVMGDVNNQALHMITADAIRPDQQDPEQLGVAEQLQTIELNRFPIQHQVIRLFRDLRQ
ncbi:hypothetical protein D3C84_1009450 [compost metagenome]